MKHFIASQLLPEEVGFPCDRFHAGLEEEQERSKSEIPDSSQSEYIKNIFFRGQRLCHNICEHWIVQVELLHECIRIGDGLLLDFGDKEEGQRPFKPNEDEKGMNLDTNFNYFSVLSSRTSLP